LRSKLLLEEAERPPGKEVHELYQALLRLRRDDPVLADQERRHMQAVALTRDLLMVRRWRAGAERMLFANFADRATRVGYAEWRLLLSSGVSPRTSNPGGWTIPPRTAVILARDD
jgi:hypothetical protein